MGRDSLVGIAARYGLDGLGIESLLIALVARSVGLWLLSCWHCGFESCWPRHWNTYEHAFTIAYTWDWIQVTIHCGL